jgi:hypothetical protein
MPAVPVLDVGHRCAGSAARPGSKGRPGRQHKLDEAYFARVDAIQFTIAHDDGVLWEDWEEADIVLAGVSRSSKTPTSIYLANRGYKVANIPIVVESPPPPALFDLRRPLVVGLTTAPDRLVQVRRNRLISLSQAPDTDYVDSDRVPSEVKYARRMFADNGWPVIDVTRRSIEETAAAVINLYNERVRNPQPGSGPCPNDAGPRIEERLAPGNAARCRRALHHAAGPSRRARARSRRWPAPRLPRWSWRWPGQGARAAMWRKPIVLGSDSLVVGGRPGGSTSRQALRKRKRICGSFRAGNGAAFGRGAGAGRNMRLEHGVMARLRVRELSDASSTLLPRCRMARGVRLRRGVPDRSALGVHLFESIEGSHFTVLGMPLLPVLAALARSGRTAVMTRPYAEVIGDPISHSKSPLIHNFWLEKLGIDAEYRACHVGRRSWRTISTRAARIPIGAAAM